MLKILEVTFVQCYVIKRGERMADMEKVKNWGADNLTGILALIAGLILLGITYRIILNLVIFVFGIMLVYFGLVRLKVTPVVSFIDTMFAKLKNVISK